MNLVYLLYALPFTLIYGLLFENALDYYFSRGSKPKKKSKHTKKELIIEWVNTIGAYALLIVYPLIMTVLKWDKPEVKQLFVAVAVEVLLVAIYEVVYFKRKRGSR